jgi:acetate kinase
MKTLVVNCGSSSLKYQLFDMTDEAIVAKGLVERIGSEGAILRHDSVGVGKITIRSGIPDHHVAIRDMMDALTAWSTGARNSPTRPSSPRRWWTPSGTARPLPPCTTP